MVLNDRRLAEMATGEGKTLVATLPTYLNALEGQGSLVVTANEYLARRDAETVGQVHRFLGLSVGLVQAEMETEDRRDAYDADVTYLTNAELGKPRGHVHRRRLPLPFSYTPPRPFRAPAARLTPYAHACLQGSTSSATTWP